MTGFILLMQSCGSVEVSHGKIRVRPSQTLRRQRLHIEAY